MNNSTLTSDLCASFSVYREFLEEREEILKHKWFESEKRGYDIGYSAALIDWILKHRNKWRKYRKGIV